jgi:hypothetical protein
MPVEKSMSMKIMQDEKPGEKEPRIPERIGNPSIQIIIRIWRCIVGDYRRTIIRVIVVDNLRARIGDVIICLCFRIFIGWLTGGRRLDCFPNHLDLIPVFLGDGFIPVGEMGIAAFIYILINDGTGRLATGGSLSGRWPDRTHRNAQTKPGLKIPYRLHSLLLSHA